MCLAGSRERGALEGSTRLMTQRVGGLPCCFDVSLFCCSFFYRIELLLGVFSVSSKLPSSISAARGFLWSHLNVLSLLMCCTLQEP